MKRPAGWIIASLAALALVACESLPTAQVAIGRLGKKFVGYSMNEFIATYGAPASERDLEDGSRIYDWVSLDKRENLPETDNPNPPIAGGSGGYLPANAQAVRMPQLHCELNIYTAPDDTIRSIVMIDDTQGRHGGSRCSEIFFTPSVQ